MTEAEENELDQDDAKLVADPGIDPADQAHFELVRRLEELCEED